MCAINTKFHWVLVHIKIIKNEKTNIIVKKSTGWHTQTKKNV